MAARLYGTVYYDALFAGILEQIPDGRFSFTYDAAYLETGHPQIAHTLFLRFAPHYSDALHPFFDNLVAEGWLARAQARALGIQGEDRFARLLAFGIDCPGAVSVRDPRPTREPDLAVGTPEEIAALANRASISGVQPKLFAIRTATEYVPARFGQFSTHIAKLPSPELEDVVELEYLTTIAAAALLPNDVVVDADIAQVRGIEGNCLLVRRFDRTDDETKIHFEEFNQLLGRVAEAKYEGSYGEMASFMLRYQNNRREEDVDRLFRRVLACILLGNNDAHLKNFGLIHTPEGFRLCPFYDVVAAALYVRFSNSGLALRVGPGQNPGSLAALSPKHLALVAESFHLSPRALTMAVADLRRCLPAGIARVEESRHGSEKLKRRLIEHMRKRWNGTFDSIGKPSLAKHDGEEKPEA